jgi:phosphotransferase system  glucose/maltose/N-acetylglucosamine-specific IIC component
METVFWVIVAIVALAVVYTCVLTFMKRKEALRRPLTAPDTNEHGVDLQARRKPFDDLT